MRSCDLASAAVSLIPVMRLHGERSFTALFVRPIFEKSRTVHKKNILVPTDFSDAANNALEYAFNLAAATSASLTILNVYHVPLPAGEFPMMLVSPHEILEKTNERLKELMAAARLVYQDKFEINGISREGFAAEEIVAAAEELKADVVVMGTTGSNSTIGTLLGSITAEVMRRSKCPVLVIPAASRYKTVRQMVLAFDYTSRPGMRAIGLLKNYALVLQAELSILNVAEAGAGDNAKPTGTAVALDNLLSDIPHQFHFVEGSDIIRELARFIAEHNSDWLVVLPHPHSIFSRMFKGSVSDQAAMQMSIPVLSIPE
jgi:nucleotide-binding universal stress UspA family protein